MDVTHLRAGEEWDDRLKELIEEADIFQLFWSSNSMYSTFVRDEWEYALSLNRRNFIRPTFWEEPMPSAPEKGLPPEALSRLNFYQIPLPDDRRFFNLQGLGQQAATVVTVLLAGLCLVLTLYFLMSVAPDQGPATNNNGGVNVNVNTNANLSNTANTNAGSVMNTNAPGVNRNGNTTGTSNVPRSNRNRPPTRSNTNNRND